MFDLQFLRRLVILNGLVPLCMLGWDAWHDQLGANRVNYAIHITGILALLFLVLSLAITPLRRLTGWQTLIAYRRSLGLYGFFYAFVHVVLYVTFDRAGNLASTWTELTTRRYLQVGLASVLIMIPLAITSTDAMVRRLGAKKWKLLHRLAYLAIALGGLHYLLLVKSDIRQPVGFLSVIGGLLAARFGWHYWDLRQTASRAAAPVSARDKPAPAAATAPKPRFWKGQLQVAKIFQETDDVRTFRLTLPNGQGLPFEYQPGQYLNLKLNIDGKQVARSYTIASSPTRRDCCEVSIKCEPMGLASRYIHENWREGTLVDVAAPAGKFVFTGKDTQAVTLIAGGVGITPVMSMLRFLTDRAWKGEIYFVFVAKTERDIIFQEELAYLQQRFPNLNLHICLTRQSKANAVYFDFHYGRLGTDQLRKWIPAIETLPVYMCGPDAMMQNTRELLEAAGVPQSRIHTEAFVLLPSADAASATAEAGPLAASAPGDRRLPTMATIAGENGNEFQLTVRDRQTPFAVSRSESILEATERVGIDIPFECRSGICGQCKIRLCEGKVHMESTYALSSKERQSGWILACQSHLATDAVVQAC